MATVISESDIRESSHDNVPIVRFWEVNIWTGQPCNQWMETKSLFESPRTMEIESPELKDYKMEIN